MWRFASENPGYFTFLIFFLVYVMGILITRFIRYKTIKNKGWPPEGIDADGDRKEPATVPHPLTERIST